MSSRRILCLSEQTLDALSDSALGTHLMYHSPALAILQTTNPGNHQGIVDSLVEAEVPIYYPDQGRDFKNAAESPLNGPLINISTASDLNNIDTTKLGDYPNLSIIAWDIGVEADLTTLSTSINQQETLTQFKEQLEGTDITLIAPKLPATYQQKWGQLDAIGCESEAIGTYSYAIDEPQLSLRHLKPQYGTLSQLPPIDDTIAQQLSAGGLETIAALSNAPEQRIRTRGDIPPGKANQIKTLANAFMKTEILQLGRRLSLNDPLFIGLHQTVDSKRFAIKTSDKTEVFSTATSPVDEIASELYDLLKSHSEVVSWDGYDRSFDGLREVIYQGLDVDTAIPSRRVDLSFWTHTRHNVFLPVTNPHSLVDIAETLQINRNTAMTPLETDDGKELHAKAQASITAELADAIQQAESL